MMTLADAAGYFDRTPILDPDTSAQLFLGQVDPYDDSRRDAGAAYRRVLSVKPGTAIPANRSVRVFGQAWLVGAREVDGLVTSHREKYVLQPAGQKVSVYRLPGFLAGAAVASLWSGIEWQKDIKQIEVDSALPQQCLTYLPSGQDVRTRDVLAYAGSAFLVLEAHEQPSGFLVASALRLDQATPSAASLVRRTFSPGTGSFTAAAPVSVQCLRVRWQSLFEYGSQADARFQEGDCSLVLPTGTAVTTRDRITFDGVTWAVVSNETLAGAVVVHARRA